MRPLLIALALAACAPPETPAAPYVVPDGAPVFRYDPLGGFTTFPDDAHTVLDPSTPTGLRVALQPGLRDFLTASIPPGITLVPALEALDGFGVTAGIVVQFSSAVDPDSLTDRWALIETNSLRAHHQADVWFTDEGRTAVFEPRQPLPGGTQLALVLQRGITNTDGEPYFAPPRFHDLLDGTTDLVALARVAAPWPAVRQSLGLDADEVIGGTVFTTQTVRTHDEAVATALATTRPTLTAAGDCVDTGQGYTTCPTTLAGVRVVGADGTLPLGTDPDLSTPQDLLVDVHLPTEGTGPFPVVIFGHGLAGDRGEARSFARRVAPLGYAVVATDAPLHGDHPSRRNAGELFWALDFFGITTGGGLAVPELRDNWRRATWDRLQLTAALRAGVDLLGGANRDLDATTLHYAGHSLGAIMGVPAVAQDPSFASAMLSVPGGRVASIVHTSPTFAPLVALLAPPGTTQSDLDRFFPLLQAAIDAGEPAIWAPDLVPGGVDVLATLVTGDDIIPNTSGRAMALALDLQHVGDVLQPTPGLRRGPDLPTSANDHGTTSAYIQLTDMLDDGVRQPATHSQIFGSATQTAWIEAWYGALAQGEPAVVVAPVLEP